MEIIISPLVFWREILMGKRAPRHSRVQAIFPEFPCDVQYQPLLRVNCGRFRLANFVFGEEICRAT